MRTQGDEEDDEERPSVFLQGLGALTQRIASPEPALVEETLVGRVIVPSAHEPPPREDQGLVLVIDDAAARRQQLERVLGMRYRVVSAENGEEGLALARRIAPDVVITNVHMPGLSGHDVCAAIKSAPGILSRTPIILLSHKDDLAPKIAALDSGADDYLVKPIHVEELRTRVRNLVRIRRQEQELLAALHTLEERDSILTEDLMQAREFQQRILPRAPAIDDLSTEAIYQPAELVGGDLYDMYTPEPRRLRVFLADAPGHGVRASLTTMFIKSEYETSKRDADAPDALLGRLNHRFAGAYGDLGLHFTALCLDIDLERRLLRWSSAAHPAPCLVRDGKARELSGGGTFVGAVDGVSYELHQEPFAPGDSVYLYTDGLTEQPNSAGDPFGEARLLAALEEAHARRRPARSVVNFKLSMWSGSVPPYDDLTFLGFRWIKQEGS
jgi:sigma-B regulation protein RsbU (phosphoserine phosphatase)